MHAAFSDAGSDERGRQVEELKWRIVQARRIDDKNKAEKWHFLMLMESHVRNEPWPPAVEYRNELIRRILWENGQVFASWRKDHSKQFNYRLEAPSWVGEVV